PVPLITADDICEVAARSSGVPLKDIKAEHGLSNTMLEEILSAHVIGQPQVITSVAAALCRAQSVLAHPNRPLASFLFLGPSGVGKTELAKTIANGVFGHEKHLIRLDMSEFSESFTLSKLIGAPAGYVGYREGAKLTDAVKQKPYSVVLFDEIEKAHPDVQNILLQILEEGEITDATGRKINFRNTVIVLTSNVGLEKFFGGGIGFSATHASTLLPDMRQELEERFRPELLNRLDHTCLFQPLSQDALAAIAQKQLREVAERLAARGMVAEIHPETATRLATLCDKKLGARDIRRLIQTRIESPLAEKLVRENDTPCVLEIVPE
ncbi:MAG TPA: AAA family ATPase, partial [Candidatus Norongarragalinales archaeon]|nr:AAA family ATPase [Candidatus Norongarragalinales archaeon]